MRKKRDLLPAAEVVDGLLVVVDVAFGLIDRGTDLAELEEPLQLRRAHVTHAQRADLAFAMQLLYFPPHFVEGYVFVRRPPV